jgi:hypothetical protein
MLSQIQMTVAVQVGNLYAMSAAVAPRPVSFAVLVRGADHDSR